jgi:hypothetical protein
LYGIVRRFKPRRVYEIGSGFSTLLVKQAIHNNQEEDCSYTCEHVAIDPFPPQSCAKTATAFLCCRRKSRRFR